jgi:hypothetical protein
MTRAFVEKKTTPMVTAFVAMFIDWTSEVAKLISAVHSVGVMDPDSSITNMTSITR